MVEGVLTQQMELVEVRGILLVVQNMLEEMVETETLVEIRAVVVEVVLVPMVQEALLQILEQVWVVMVVRVIILMVVLEVQAEMKQTVLSELIIL